MLAIGIFFYADQAQPQGLIGILEFRFFNPLFLKKFKSYLGNILTILH